MFNVVPWYLLCGDTCFFLWGSSVPVAHILYVVLLRLILVSIVLQGTCGADVYAFMVPQGACGEFTCIKVFPGARGANTSEVIKNSLAILFIHAVS